MSDVASSPCAPETVNRRRSWKRRVSSRGRRRSEKEKWLHLFDTSRDQPGGGGENTPRKRSPRGRNNNHRTDSPAADAFFFHNKYKRELCNNYRETGWCRYGLNCNYAHGREELRTKTHGNKKINKTCMHYHGIGICMFGIRCRYIHETKEEIAQMRNPKKIVIAQTIEFPIPEVTSETHIPLYKRGISHSI